MIVQHIIYARLSRRWIWILSELLLSFLARVFEILFNYINNNK